MKPEHIKEAIPSLAVRIKFEHLYDKFLSGLDEVIILNVPDANNVPYTWIPYRLLIKRKSLFCRKQVRLCCQPHTMKNQCVC